MKIVNLPLNKFKTKLNSIGDFDGLYDELKNIENNMIESGEAFVSNNSYCNDSTGYNLVEDLEYSEEYENLLEKISLIEEYWN